MITLLVMTDGRGEYLKRTLASFDEMVTGTVTRKVIHDDSGDSKFNEWLVEYYGDQSFEVTPDNYPYRWLPGERPLAVHHDRLGYSGAVQQAWRYLDDVRDVNVEGHHFHSEDTNRFTFHLEDDYVFNRPVDLDLLAEFLDVKWWLAQVALRRQRWGTELLGFVEDNPGAYREIVNSRGWDWLEHRNYYTMTPHLYRSRLRQLGWPDGDRGETEFTKRILEQGLPWNVRPTDVQFAFWGGFISGAEWVTHIGEERLGYGY